MTNTPGSYLIADISIHAARVGCDYRLPVYQVLPAQFQSTQPEWAATTYTKGLKGLSLFQSTQPEWAATQRRYAEVNLFGNFNPRSPSGLRQPVEVIIYPKGAISIHAARVGCDHQRKIPPAQCYNFNPRSPSGLRHKCYNAYASHPDFNPRSPSGLRPDFCG